MIDFRQSYTSSPYHGYYGRIGHSHVRPKKGNTRRTETMGQMLQGGTGDSWGHGRIPIVKTYFHKVDVRLRTHNIREMKHQIIREEYNRKHSR